MSRYFSFSELAAEMSGDWGLEGQSLESAITDLIKRKDVGSAALLYIVGLLEQLRPTAKRNSPNSQERKLGRPDDAKSFPGVRVGDFLYWADLDDDGYVISRFLVVQVMDNSECVIISADDDYADEIWVPEPRYASSNLFATAEEALAKELEDDLTYHREKLVMVDMAHKNLEANDLSGYFAWNKDRPTLTESE